VNNSDRISTQPLASQPVTVADRPAADLMLDIPPGSTGPSGRTSDAAPDSYGQADAGEPCSVTTLKSIGPARWDEYVRGHPEGSFFHLDGWREAVKASFGHRDDYLVARRGDRIVGVLPMFLVKSMASGRMLVSVPYGVGGGILADDKFAASDLLEAAKDLARDDRAGVIDFRSSKAAVAELPVVDRYVGFRRELPGSSSDVLGWLPRKARAAARNARNKYGLTVSFGDDHLQDVWRMYSLSMRRLGSLNYPRAFFRTLIERSLNHHMVSIVHRRGEPVAGLLSFMFNRTVMPYFIGTTDQARTCSAANFIYLTLMQRAVDEGYRTFDFGRSRRDNKGSFDFKRFCGFSPEPLEYQYYTPPGRTPPDLTPGNPRVRLVREIWKRLPLGVTRPAGAYLARHLPG